MSAIVSTCERTGTVVVAVAVAVVKEKRAQDFKVRFVELERWLCAYLVLLWPQWFVLVEVDAALLLLVLVLVLLLLMQQ